MARFELHKTFRHPKESEMVAAADRLSECIRAWEGKAIPGLAPW
jgi:hypothetical protein